MHVLQLCTYRMFYYDDGYGNLQVATAEYRTGDTEYIQLLVCDCLINNVALLSLIRPGMSDSRESQ